MTPWKTRFYTVLGPLQWGFTEGDDGDSISLAIDEIDSLLRELTKFKRSKTEGLAELLSELDDGSQVSGLVEELAEIGSRSRYGEGLDAKDAKRATKQADKLANALDEIVNDLLPASKTTKRTTKKAGARSSKRRDAKG